MAKRNILIQALKIIGMFVLGTVAVLIFTALQFDAALIVIIVYPIIVIIVFIQGTIEKIKKVRKKKDNSF